MKLTSLCIVVLAFGSVSISNLAAAQTKLNLDDTLVVLNSEDKRYWQMDVANAPLKQPIYPVGLIRANVSGCVSIGFFIEPDGTTSGYRILKSSVIGARLSTKQKKIALAMFSKSALGSLVAARFVAGSGNPSKQRGFSQVPYTFSTAPNEKKIQGKCRIADLAVFLESSEAEEQE